MASPPFSLNITAPANTDIAANFPTLDRSDKDVIQSWITTMHNNQGRLLQGAMDQIGTAFGLGAAPVPVANTATMWYDATNVWMEQRAFTATTVQLSVPVGAILAWPAASAPAGYLLCQGQSLATTGLYANLFGVIGYVWGGSGANFNIPDLRGRTLFGLDSGQIRILGGTSIGLTGGSNVISQANIPNYNLTVNDPGHLHTGNTGFWVGQNHNQSSPAAGNDTPISATNNWSTLNATTNISVNSAGSGTQFLPPLAIVNWIIRAF